MPVFVYDDRPEQIQGTILQHFVRDVVMNWRRRRRIRVVAIDVDGFPLPGVVHFFARVILDYGVVISKDTPCFVCFVRGDCLAYYLCCLLRFVPWLCPELLGRIRPRFSSLVVEDQALLVSYCSPWLMG